MDRSLKIAIISTQRDWYGGEQQLWLLAKGLRDRGHDVHVLARQGGKLARRMREDRFAVNEFPGNGRGPAGLWQIRRHLRRIRPDVLHYNDPHALTSAGVASIGLLIPARIAVRHVVWPIRSPWRARAFCDRVICVAEAVAQVCRNAGLPQKMLKVVFYSTDREKILAGKRVNGRRAAGIDDDRPMILVVASLNKHKGHALLIETLPQVLSRHPKACVVFAGDGPEKASLQNYAEQLGVGQNVHFLGYRRDVPDLMQAADLLVLPSLDGEGMPVTLLDAMFAGVPIIATAVGGTGEMLADDPSGQPVAWLVPPANSQALASAVLDALARPAERSRRAMLARQRAEYRFPVDRMVEDTLQTYREVLLERHSRRIAC